MPLVTSANIACGAHAGDLITLAKTVACAAGHGTAIGAHPGYFDWENFGRREHVVSPEEASRLVLLQVERCFEVAGPRLRHVKLHGALYHQVSHDAALAAAVVDDLARLWPGLILFALAGSCLVEIARARGVRVAEEVFADRTYQPDGSLTPRSAPNALIADPEAGVRQVIRMIEEGLVRANDGTEVVIRADTICVHGDGPDAVTLVKQLRQALERAGIEIKAFNP